jgi:hypothetical protein
MASCILSDIAKECADSPRPRVKHLDEAQRVASLLNAYDVEQTALSPARGAAVFRYGPGKPVQQSCFYCSAAVVVNKHTVRESIRKLTFYPAYHVSICQTCCNILNQ